MDEIGVHSRLNATKPIVPGKGTASPVQTVAGKDLSNPFMAVTLPKSETEEEISSKTRRKLPQTFTGSTSRARSRPIKKIQNKSIEQIIKNTIEGIFKQQTQTQSEDKHENPVAVPPEISLTPRKNSEPNQNLDDVDHVSETNTQDPNADDDSAMSFDSVALHNLST
ncbi:hypothetical protein RND71_039983 [Anisodus tanguticus]|uniref:Uncharacterized protein n=1 Tax=Anisodus tanguticus TaxID=243964 RepID=A0AAE1USH2_9SOLA|nr:hypothetical protein RND71_039983 [Anisodus tanguticus]